MKETSKLLKLKSLINVFADEVDSQALYLIGQYNSLSKKIELTITPAQATRNVTDAAYYLKKIYDIARGQIEKISKNESTIINKYKKICNFFIGASVSPVSSFFLKKMDNSFLNSKVVTENFFLDLAREMLSSNVKQEEKDAKENKSISSDPKLSILGQLEMIIVLKNHDKASKYLNNCKDFIDGFKSNEKAGLSQSTLQMSRELAVPLQCLFEIAKDSKLDTICNLFKDFAVTEKQSNSCVSNCVKASQSTSEKLALSVAEVILHEEVFFDARPTGSHAQPEFRFSRYQEIFSPISLEQRFFTTDPTLPRVPTFSNQMNTRFSYNSSEFDCYDQTSEASSSRNSLR